jgi:molybdate transport system substrate-binding protein
LNLLRFGPPKLSHLLADENTHAGWAEELEDLGTLFGTMLRFMKHVLGSLLVLLLVPACAPAREEARGELMVFAAASLRDALVEQAALFERQGGTATAFNFAGSNVLALQLEASPRSADLFISANEAWMDHVEEAGLVDRASRVVLLSNRLVVVGSEESSLSVDELGDIASPEVRYLALGDPKAVPAGSYARAALEGVPFAGGTLWEAVAERVAPAADVRGALALTEARVDTLGIVYRSDAASSRRVLTLLEIPEDLTPRIAYSAAVLRESPRRQEAVGFLDFLATEVARDSFEGHGFLVPPP